MNCRGVLDALADYLEGDAGSTVCKKIEEHLRGCERCRMHIDTMRKIVTLCKKWRAEPIPEDVQMRLRSVVARECVLRGIDPQGGSATGHASASSARKTTGRKPASRTGRKSRSRKPSKSSAKKPKKK
jgi:hypothetical protein